MIPKLGVTLISLENSPADDETHASGDRATMASHLDEPKVRMPLYIF